MGPIETKLREAAALPRTKGAFARNSYGKVVDSKSKHAVSWCPSGAITRVAGSVRAEELRVLLSSACESIANHPSIPVVNDSYGDLILDCQSEAIEAAHELEKAGKL